MNLYETDSSARSELLQTKCKPVVYIAGPYTIGDQAENIRNAIKAADEIMDVATPIVPHLSMLWHLVTPRLYDDWLKLGLEYVEISDAVLLLPGKSPGAERECARAIELDIPVFLRASLLRNWAETWQTNS